MNNIAQLCAATIIHFQALAEWLVSKLQYLKMNGRTFLIQVVRQGLFLFGMANVSQGEFRRQMQETEFSAEILHWDTYGHKNGNDDLYFITNSTYSVVKIGRSKDVKKRLASLQTGSSDKLEIVAVIKSKGFMEPHFHRCLSDYKISGEWFSACPRIGLLLTHILINPFPRKPIGTLNIEEVEDVRFNSPKLKKPQPADFGDTKMPFGKWRGLKLSKIPIDYMVWFVNNCSHGDIVPYFIEKIGEDSECY